MALPAAGSALRKPGFWLGWPLVLLSTLSFSIAPPISKAVIELGVNPTAMLAARLSLTTLLLGSTLSLTGSGRGVMDRRGVFVAIVAGLVNGVGMLAYFWSLTRLEASLASMLSSSSPLLTLTLLALRGEKFTSRNFIRIALGLGGLYLLIGPGGQVDWLGVGLIAIGICSNAVQLSFIQWYLQGHNSRLVTFYMTCGMVLVIVGYWLVQGSPWTDPGVGGWAGIVTLAIICTYLARLLLVRAIRNVGSAQVALLAPLETLLTVIWSLSFLGEHLSLWQWLGGGLIMSSALLAVHRFNRVRVPTVVTEPQPEPKTGPV